MANELTRVTDLALAFPHGSGSHRAPLGQIITGSSVVSIENLPAARVTDIVLYYCGHTGIIVTGVDITDIDNLPAASIGDLTAGIGGTLISGSSVMSST
jgi:uncharacterized Zn-binding protein involved in type VI secretion